MDRIIYRVRPVFSDLLLNYMMIFFFFSPVTMIVVLLAGFRDLHGLLAGIIIHGVLSYFVTIASSPKNELVYFPETRELQFGKDRKTIQIQKDCRLILRRTNSVQYNTKTRKPKSWLKKHKREMDGLQRQIDQILSTDFDLEGYHARIPKVSVSENELQLVEQLKERLKREKGSRLRKVVYDDFQILVWCPNGTPIQLVNAGKSYKKAVELIESLVKDLDLMMIDHTGVVPVLIEDTDRKVHEEEVSFDRSRIPDKEIPKKLTMSFFDRGQIFPTIALFVLSVPLLTFFGYLAWFFKDNPILTGFFLFISIFPLLIFIVFLKTLKSLYRKEIVYFDLENLRVKQVIWTPVGRRVIKMDLRNVERILPVWRDDHYFLELVSDEARIPFGYTSDYKELFSLQRAILNIIQKNS
ncbi:MAG: hypothetical protein D6732_29705 [Methanobacteriota archaeon]|nr:MAG: hypothetical protein D6732_29705 [Euryarchaeota archaeon]